MPSMSRAIVGAVLAGGLSRRMGRDKASLTVDGRPLADRAAAMLATLLPDTVVGVGAGGAAVPTSCPVIRDRFAGAGPLAGLESALHWAGGRPVFVLACDLPRLMAEHVEVILSAAEAGAQRSADARAWVAAYGGRRQPLCGLYTAACGPRAMAALRRQERAMHRFLDGLDTALVALDDLGPDPLLNLNTPADGALLTAPSDRRR
jgi:molybdopterin-guanine dinucleotide biosynthesis protein A